MKRFLVLWFLFASALFGQVAVPISDVVSPDAGVPIFPGGNVASTVTATTGTGNVVRATSPTLVTPTLGAASATSINGLGVTNSTGTLTIANGKTLTASNTLTFTGTDGSSVNFGAGGTVLYSGGSYVSSITGTANQITASASTGPVTLSLPTAISGVNSITAAATNNLTLSPASGKDVIVSPGGAGHLVLTNSTDPAIIGQFSSMNVWAMTSSSTTKASLLALQPSSSIDVYVGGNNPGNQLVSFTTSGFVVAPAGTTSLTLFGAAGASAITGGAGNMTITAGTGNSRTMAFKTTTSGGVATNALVLGADQSATFTGPAIINSSATGYVQFSAPGWTGNGVAYFGPNLNSSTSSTGDYFGFNVPTGKGYTLAINASSAMLLDATNGLILGSPYKAQLQNTTDASALGTASVVLSGGLSVAKKGIFGDSITQTINGNALVAITSTSTSDNAAGLSLTRSTTGSARAWRVGVGDFSTDEFSVTDSTAGQKRFSINSSGTVSASTGDLSVDTVGKTLKVKSGTNAKAGTFTASGASNVVNNTSVTANSVIEITIKTPGGTQSGTRVSATSPGTSFTVATNALDTSVYNYIIFEVN